MQERAQKDLEPCQGEIAGNFKRPLEEAGGNQLSHCSGAPGKPGWAGGVRSDGKGWTGRPAVTHGLIPAGRGDGESPRGRRARGALGVTSPLNGVPRRQLFVRLPQKGFGFSLSRNLSPPHAAERPWLLQCSLPGFSHLSSSPWLATEESDAKPCFSFPTVVSRRGCTQVTHGAKRHVPRGMWAGTAGPFPCWNLFLAMCLAYLFDRNSCKTGDINQAWRVSCWRSPPPLQGRSGVPSWHCKNPFPHGLELAATTQLKSPWCSH